MRRRVLACSLLLCLTAMAGCKRKAAPGPQTTRTGELVVTSVPKGAVVYLDGRALGRTPFVSRIRTGYRHLEIRQAGRQSWKGRIVVLRGKRVVRAVTLQPALASRHVRDARNPNAANQPTPAFQVPGSALKAGSIGIVKGMPGMKRVVIPAGSFLMGSPKHADFEDEKPQHKVTFTRSLWMLQTEVTQGQFKQLMKYDPSYFTGCGTRCPAEQVTWHQALAFANALSQHTGVSACYTCREPKKKSDKPNKKPRCKVKKEYKGKQYVSCPGWRLPTEAEWEYAARAGTTGQRYGAIEAVAWYDRNSSDQTHEVAQKAANAWGLYDMLGNVSEWTWDRHGRYKAKAVVDPVGPSSGRRRVLRGGSWYRYAQSARAANRDFWKPANRNSVGFRLVRQAP